MNRSKKILIISPAWIGDIILAQSLFKYLKHRNSKTIIDVLAPSWSQELYSCMPEMNHFFVMPLGHAQFQFIKRWQLGKELREKKYDQAIILPNSWKSAIIPLAAHIPVRTGWLGEMRVQLLNDWRVLNKKTYPMMVQRFIALGDAQSFIKNKVDWFNFKPHLTIPSEHKHLKDKKLSSMTNKPYLIVCPGAAYGPAKRWPTNYFADIINSKKSNDGSIVLLGATADIPIGIEIQKLTKNACINLIGKTSLMEAIALLSFATLVISNDSGLMHIAAALDRPLIAIYGSTNPKFTPPLSERAKIVYLNLHCSPCFKRKCPFTHLNCLKQLTPQMVLKTIDDLTKN